MAKQNDRAAIQVAALDLQKVNDAFRRVSQQITLLEGRSGGVAMRDSLAITSDRQTLVDFDSSTAGKGSIVAFGTENATLALAKGSRKEDNGEWIATDTASTIFALDRSGNGTLYYNSGLTVGQAFTPTSIYVIGSGGSAGVTDHGALTGLADDDHTQYVLAAGDTMTGSLVTTSAASDNSEQVTIEGTNADSGASGLKFKKLSASPAASDYLGHIRFAGYDSGNNLTNYVRVSGVAKTLTDGAEEGTLQLGVATAGAVANTVVISPSLVDVTGAVTLSGTLTANGAVAGNIPRKLHVNTTPVGNVGTGNDDLITYAVPAGLLSADGAYLHATFSGTFAANANAKTGTIYFGSAGSLVISNGSSGVLSWLAEMWVVRTGATTQSIHIRGNSNGGAVYNQWVAGTETLSNSITIKVVGTGTANNDIVQKFLLVEYFP